MSVIDFSKERTQKISSVTLDSDMVEILSVAVKSAVKRDKSAVQCLPEHTDMNVISVVHLA
jgi:hypothetical protein